MIKAKCNGLAINQMVIADCYNCIIHIGEKKCRVFFLFFFCGVEGCCVLSVASKHYKKEEESRKRSARVAEEKRGCTHHH